MFRKRREIGYEYWIPIEDIKVSEKLKRTEIKKESWRRNVNYWNENGIFKNPILIDKDFNLVDGYDSFLIADMHELKKIPVHFVS